MPCKTQTVTIRYVNILYFQLNHKFCNFKVVPKISERLIEFHISSAPDIEDLNIVEDGSSSKESKAPVPDHGRKQNLENAARLQTGSPGVSTVAVKRKPRTQVAESLAKVILQI